MLDQQTSRNKTLELQNGKAQADLEEQMRRNTYLQRDNGKLKTENASINDRIREAVDRDRLQRTPSTDPNNIGSRWGRMVAGLGRPQYQGEKEPRLAPLPVLDESEASSQLPTPTAVCGTTTGVDGAFKAPGTTKGVVSDGETEKPTAGVETGDEQQKEKPQEENEAQDKKEESDDKPLGLLTGLRSQQQHNQVRCRWPSI